MKKEIDIEQANHDQLIEFAKLNNIEVRTSEKPDSLRSRIKQAMNVSTIEIDVNEGPTVSPVPFVKKATDVPARGADDPITIIVHDNNDGTDHVKVSVNGTAMIIRKGEPSTIKYKYYAAIKNAVMDVYEVNRDGGLGAKKEVPLYGMQVLD